MTSFKVIYSSNPPEHAREHDPGGTSGFHQASTATFEDLVSDQTRVVEFKLRDTSSVTKFLDVWNSPTNYHNYSINYNEYHTLSLEKRYEYQQEMNDVIDAINTNFTEWSPWTLDESLKLIVGETEPELDKLNALHRDFEDISYEVIKMRDEPGVPPNLEDLYQLLEKVNYLVHRMERVSNDNTNWYYTVIRNASINDSNYYTLTDEDYMLFENEQRPGVLYADFSTVGKDLSTCWATDDVALVKAGEVKQQEFIKPYVNYKFQSGTDDRDYDAEYADRQTRYYKWCEDNELGEVVDFRKPMYRIGRIPLGDIVDTSIDEFEEIIQNYPYIVGVFVE